MFGISAIVIKKYLMGLVRWQVAHILPDADGSFPRYLYCVIFSMDAIYALPATKIVYHSAGIINLSEYWALWIINVDGPSDVILHTSVFLSAPDALHRAA